MIRPRDLPDSIVAQLVPVSAFLHSLGQKLPCREPCQHVGCTSDSGRDHEKVIKAGPIFRLPQHSCRGQGLPGTAACQPVAGPGEDDGGPRPAGAGLPVVFGGLRHAGPEIGKRTVGRAVLSLLLATSGSQDHAPATSGLPPASDLNGGTSLSP